LPRENGSRAAHLGTSGILKQTFVHLGVLEFGEIKHFLTKKSRRHGR